jgi:prevent-host-death family protein
MAQRTIPASEFKAKCLALLDEVAENGQSLVVTKRGKPVARVVPVEKPESLLGSVKFLVSDEELVNFSLGWKLHDAHLESE